MDETELAMKCRDTMWQNDLAAQAVGITVSVDTPGAAEARMQVRKEMVNGHDICHGGYIFTLADTAFAYACNTYNRVTVAASASIEFVRPARLGDELTACVEEVHRGGRIGIYDTVVTNGAGDQVAIFRGRSYATREPVVQSDTE
jgi:acyl-CoA thioesterase